MDKEFNEVHSDFSPQVDIVLGFKARVANLPSFGVMFPAQGDPGQIVTLALPGPSGLKVVKVYKPPPTNTATLGPDEINIMGACDL